MACDHPKCCELETKVKEDLKEYCESLHHGDVNGCFFYMVDGSSNLYQVDNVTGASTLIGPTGYSSITDIAWDGSDLYGITGGNLIQINTGTGAGSLIGAMGTSGNALEAGPLGVLYMMGGNNFYSVNKVTGIATLIGPMGPGFISSGDLAWDPVSLTMYGSFNSGNLGSINVGTGVATVIGPFGFNPVWGLDFCGSVMYGVTSGGQLITVDPSTGVSTFVANTGISPVWGMAAVETAFEIPCEAVELPNLEPIFTVRYGEIPSDLLETTDVQCLCITACNPYNNVSFKDVQLLITEVFDSAGDPVDPGRFLLKPGKLVCFGDLAPCAELSTQECACAANSCESREFVIVTRNAAAGVYTVSFEYCYEVSWCQPNSFRFEIEVV